MKKEKKMKLPPNALKNGARALGLTALLLALQLTVPVGQADAPPGRYTINEEAETVYDNMTGLTWQRFVPPNKRYNMSADSYCAALSLDGGGWRLPTVLELLSIIDRTRVSPAHDPEAFPDAPSERYFSSSIAESGSSRYQWYVSSIDGTVGSGWAIEGLVRCVR